MCSKDGRGSLIRRIAAIVLCALITVAYTPGLAFAIESPTDSTTTSVDEVDGNAVVNDTAGESSGGEETFNGENADPAGDSGAVDVTEGKDSGEEEPETTAPAGIETSRGTGDDSGGEGEAEEPVENGNDEDPDDGADGDDPDIGDEDDEPLTIRLTVDDNNKNVLINEAVKFSVSTTGYPDEVRIYRDYEGEGDEPDEISYYNSFSDEDVWVGYETAGTYKFRVEACIIDYDENTGEESVRESVADEAVITASGNGTLEDFSITEVNGSAVEGSSGAVTVTRGETITVKCENAVDGDVNAVHYWLEAIDVISDKWAGHFADTDKNYISFNTIYLEPGEYRMTVGANAPGYSSKSSYNSFKLTVEDLTIPDDEEMYLSVSKTEVTTCEPLEFTAYCPGAEEIYAYMDYEGNDDWTQEARGNILNSVYEYRRAGTYKLVVFAGYYDKDEEEWQESYAEKEITVTATETEELNIVAPSLPSYIDLSKMTGDFEFDVAVPDNADGLRVEASADYEKIFEEEKSEGTVSAAISKDELQDGINLEIRIEAWGRGYNGTDIEFNIPIIGSIAEDALTITTSASGDGNVLVNQPINIYVSSEQDLSQLMFYDGERWNYGDYSYENGTYRYGIRFGRPGTYTVIVKAQPEGSDEDEWITGMPLTFNVTSNGQVGEFSILQVNEKTDLSKAIPVTRGDMVSIKYEEADNAGYYWLDVQKRDFDSESGWSNYDVHGGSDGNILEFGTIEMEPGNYRIRVGGGNDGYENRMSDNFFDLTVTDLEFDEDDPVYFELSGNALDGLTTCEEFTFSAYYPNAKEIWVYPDYAGNPGWYMNRWNSDSYSDQISYNSSGTYKLVAVAYGFDEDGDWYELSRSEVKEVTVTKTKEEDLDPPGFSGLPVSHAAGTELSFTVNMPNNAEHMRVEVRSEGGYYENLIEQDTREASLTVTIPAEKLKDGMILKVFAEAEGYGYEASRGEATVPVLGAGNEGLRLSIEPEEIWVGDDVHITVDTSGLETEGRSVEYVEYFNGEEFRGIYSSDEGGVYEEDIDFWQGGNYVIFARAALRSDDEEESIEYVSSAPQTITVQSHGKTGNFRITKVNGTEGAESVTVQQGDIVSVSYGTSAHADHYWIDVDKRQDYGWEWRDHYADTGETTAYLSTGDLEPGEYQLAVKANGPGYDNTDAENRILMTVVKSTLPEDGMKFVVSKTELTTNEEFTYSAYCPSADYITVYMDYDNDQEWTADSNNYKGAYDRAGEYNLTAVGYKLDPDSQKEVEVARVSRTMTVTSEGEIDIKMPSLPPYINLSEMTGDLEFTVDLPDHADGMRIEVRDEESDTILFSDETDSEQYPVTVDKNMLTEGMRLRVSIDAWGRGYDASGKDVRISVLGAGNEDLRLSIEPDEIWVGDDVHITVDTSGLETEGRSVEYVEYFDGEDFQWMDVSENAGVYTGMTTFWEGGDYVIYARAAFQSDDGEGSIEYVSSAPQAITVQSHGKTGNFRVKKVNGTEGAESVTVQQGDIVSVSYGTSAHANHYWIDVERRQDYGWEWCGHYADTEDTTAYLPTGTLEPGNYQLNVKANGPGYDNTDAENRILMTVVESTLPEDGMQFIVSKTELETFETFTYSVYCPSADYIMVYMDYENDQEWTAENENYTEVYDRAGEYNLTAVAYRDGEVINSVSRMMTVTSNGELDLSIPANVPNSIEAGKEDNTISFTVTKPEHAYGVKARVWVDGEEESPLFEDETENDSMTVSFDATELQEGDVVIVQVEAWGRGYDYTSREKRIPVIGAASEQVKLEAKKSDPPVGEEIGITAVASGDDSIAEVQLYDGYNFREYTEEPDDDGVYRTTIRFNEAGPHTIYAKVRLDGSDEWLTTNTVTITATSEGKLVIEPIELPDKLCPGNSLEVTLNRPEHAHSYGIEAFYFENGDIENGYRLLYGSYDTDDASDIWTEDEDSLTLNIPADVLSEGLTFYVKLKGWGIGYEFNECIYAITVGHDLRHNAAVEASCEADGMEEHYECSACHKLFVKDGDEYIETTEADVTIPGGHKYGELIEEVPATCEADGMAAHYECSTCHKLFVKEGDEYVEKTAEELRLAGGHKYGELIEEVPAGCDADGMAAHYECSECHKLFVKDGDEYVEKTAEELRLAGGHNYGDLIAEVPASCEADGMAAHYECSTCHKLFVKDDDEYVETTEAELTITGGHKYGELIEEVPATCGQDGVAAHYECSECHKLFVKDGDEYIETTEAELIIPGGPGSHAYGSLIAEVPASCEADGMAAHYECSECHKLFVRDGDEYVEKTAEELRLAGGHKYGDLVAEVPASCEADGMAAHYECSTCHKLFVKDDDEYVEKTVAELKLAGGHKYGDLIAEVPASCEADGMAAHYECSTCHKLFVKNGDEYVEKTAAELKLAGGHKYGDLIAEVPASCEADGMATHYECSECHKLFVKDGDEYVEKTASELKLAGGHKYGDLIAEVPATCSQSGVAAHYECSECHKLFVKNGDAYDEKTEAGLIIAATGKHTAGPATEENRVEETKDNIGHYDKVVYCSVCHEEMSRETIELRTLHDAKEAALADLATKESKLNEYDAEDRAELQKAIDDARTAIEDAETVDAVNTASRAAASAISSKKTTAQKAEEAAAEARRAADAAKAAAAAAAAKKAEDARQGIPDSKIAKVKISKPAAAKKAVTAKWKKLTSKQIKKGKVKKYEIWVCPNKAFGASDTIMKEVSKSKSSGKVKVPKKGTYYVKVRAIRKVGGVKYVGKWSSPKKVKVKK